MKSFMEYKGYQGSVQYNDEDQVFFGQVMFIPALLSYEGTAVKSLKKSFERAVNDYLELCKVQNKQPAEPFKGSFKVRMNPELHRRAVLYANEHEKSLNRLVSEALERYLTTAEQ